MTTPKSGILLRTIGWVTVILAFICIILGIILGILGQLDNPVDNEATILGACIIFFYVAQLFLLRFSKRRQFKAGYWIAFLGTVVPVAGVLVFLAVYA